MRVQIIICFYVVSITENYGKDVRILGGKNTDAAEYPFMASLRYAIQNIIFCGGAIISNKHILTAAHCLYEKQHEYYKIRIYTGITTSLSINGGVNEILHVYYPPEYTGLRTNEEMYRHDIAVVEVKETLEFTECQNVIELPSNDFNNYQLGWLIGWGSTTYPIHTVPQQLQKLLMRATPKKKCSHKFSFKIHPGQICAYMNTEVGPYIGDEGSPLVISNEIIGIVSINFPCLRGQPDLYTNVYYYLDFIRRIIGT